MVKGVSRQVIVVHAPEPKLFEQAIFILHEDALAEGGITDEQLLQEAKKLIRNPAGKKKRNLLPGPVWACVGAAVTALAWLISSIL